MRFRIGGRESVWSDTVAILEDKVSIENIFFVSVLGEGTKSFFPGVVYPETGRGNWEVTDYHPQYATDLVIANKPNSSLACKLSVPMSGYYQGWISILADSDDSLGIGIKKPRFKHKIRVKLKKSKDWALVALESLYLKEGEYTLSFKNSKGRILIDYFLLVINKDSK